MTGSAAAVPVSSAVVSSRDPAEVQELISGRYVEHRPRIVRGTDGYVFDSSSAWAGGLTVDRITWGATMAITADPFETVLVVGVDAGRFDVSANGLTCQAGRGQTVLYPPGVPIEVVMDRMTYDVVQFPLDALTRAASRLDVAPVDLRVEGLMPVSPAADRSWQATSAYLARLLTDEQPSSRVPSLVLAAAIDAAAAAVLAAFPNNTMTVDYVAGPGRVAPAAIRRAVAYIEAHADQPITLDDIAAAAGISARGLQAGFARHRDTTPLGYLRRVRMHRAHRDLQNGDRARGDSVAEIARRWGFTSLGRFSADYRAAYGQTPGQTLRT